MKLRLFVVLWSLIAIGTSYGQESLPVRVDHELWSTLKVKYKLNDQINLYAEQALRLNDNISTINTIFTETSLKYKLPYSIDLGAGYRYVYGEEGMQRFFASLDYSANVSRIGLELSSKLEYNDERLPSEDDQFRWREKLSINYNIRKSKWKPKVFVELFMPINDGIEFNRWRAGARLGYDIRSNHEVTLGWQMQDTQRRKSIRRDFIYVCIYEYSF